MPDTSDSLPKPTRAVLIARLSAHGDVIHTVPLLAALKRQYPEAVLGWLVEESAAPLLANHPLIDHLHVVRRKQWLKSLFLPHRWPAVVREVRALLSELRQVGYQVGVDAQGLLKSALWLRWAGLPIRLGFSGAREQADRFYTHKLAPLSIRDPRRKAVDQCLDLARALDCEVDAPEFVLPPPSEEALLKTEQLLGTAAASGKILVGMAPFTRWESKHWIPAYWAWLMADLLKQGICPVLIGAPGDRAGANVILNKLGASAEGVLDLVGLTDWPDLYALLPRLHLVLGPDSAPLHMADALGVPVLGLYGPTAPGRTGPIGAQAVSMTAGVDCQPCFERRCPLKTHACMQQLTPESVLNVVAQRLQATAGPV